MFVIFQLNKSYLSQDEFNADRVNNASKACGPLCAWVISQVRFSSILDRVQPLKIEVASLEAAGQSLELEREHLERNVAALEASIEKYKRVCFPCHGDAILSFQTYVSIVMIWISRTGVRNLDS